MQYCPDIKTYGCGPVTSDLMDMIQCDGYDLINTAQIKYEAPLTGAESVGECNFSLVLV